MTLSKCRQAQTPKTPEGHRPWSPELLEDEDDFALPWCPGFDEAEIEVALEPVLKEILCQEST